MSSEIIKMHRVNDDKTEVVEQYPVTITNAVYDSVNEQFLNETIAELMGDGGSQAIEELRDEVNQRLEQITTIEDAQKTAQFGENLIDANGWTLGAGWSGNLASGFTHSKGQTLPLRKTVAIEAFKFYQVEITVQSPSNTMASNSGWTISLGGSVPFEMYEGNFTEHTYKRGLMAMNTNNELVITPQTGFDGTITNVVVKEIVTRVEPTFVIKDKNDIAGLEIKPTAPESENTFIGLDNAINLTTGKNNVGVGIRAMKNATSAFWNVVMGYEAGMMMETASRNVILGYIAGKNNRHGHRNVVAGSFAFHDNVDGHNNIVFGADTMQHNVSGSYNFAAGVGAMGDGRTNMHNIAIGRGALIVGQSLQHNVALGDYALANLDNVNARSIALGQRALYNATTGDNIAVGDFAGNAITTATDNVFIGKNAGRYITTGERNIIVGGNSGGVGNTIRNVVLGGLSGTQMTTGANYNTIVGNASGTTITSGANNILVGYNVQTQSPTEQFYLNIGNTLFGWMGSNQKRIGIGVENPFATLHLKASNGSTGSAPIRFTAGTLLSTKVDGALEFDGTELYFTIGNTRKKITMEVA